MAQKNINIGTPNGQDGDFVRDAFSKAEDNFIELYSLQNLSDRIISASASWRENLIYDVVVNQYIKNNKVLPVNGSIVSTITLSPADPTNPRIDVIVVTEDENIIVIEGTPSSEPIEPVLTDYNTQLKISSVLILAGATEPSDIVKEVIYAEGVGEPSEWSPSTFINATTSSTTDPDSGTNSVETTGIQDGNSISFFSVTDISINNATDLKLRIKKKDISPCNYNLTFEYDGNRVNRNSIEVKALSYGFDITNTTDYQTVLIPINDFVLESNIIDTFRIESLIDGGDVFIDNIEIIYSGTIIQGNNDYIEEVTLAGNILSFSSKGRGFTGDIDFSSILGDISTGLEALDEGNGVGWRLIGQDPSKLLTIGKGSVDLQDNSTITGVGYGIESEGGFAIGNSNILPLNGTNFGLHIGIGAENTVEGYWNNIALGTRNIITNGYSSLAVGYGNTINLSATAGQGAAIGTSNNLTNYWSFAIGAGLNSKAKGMVALGMGNTEYTGTVTDITRPVLVVGNGNVDANAGSYGDIISTSDAFIVRYDGSIEAPSITNALIDSIGDKSLVSREWVLNNITTGLEAIDEGNGIGYRLVNRNPDNYGNVGLEAVDLSFSNGNPSTLAGATGDYSLCTGFNSTSSNTGTVAIGVDVEAAGRYSFAAGIGNVSPSYGEVSLGTNGTTYTVNGINNFNNLDRVLNIGIGLTSGTRKDAFTILKNGTITAPSLTPSLIDIAGDSSLITKEYADINYLGESNVLTDAEIKVAYENNTNTNAFTDLEKSNLSDQSGVNTGDENTSSIQNKRPLKTVNGQSIEGNGNLLITEGDINPSIGIRTVVNGYILTVDDIGTVLYYNGTEDITIQIPNDITLTTEIGSNFTFWSTGTGKIFTINDTGVTAPTVGSDKFVSFQSMFTMIKIANNTWYPQGDCTSYIPVVIDPDAQAFIDAVGTLSVAEEDAIKDLVAGFKANNTWDKYSAIYPFIGGTEDEHKWNLKDPQDTDAAFRLTFNGGWTHDSNGITGNGTDTFAETYIDPATVLSADSLSYALYSRTDVNEEVVDFGIQDGANSRLSVHISWSDGNLYSDMYSQSNGRVTTPSNGTDAFFSFVKNSNTDQRVFKNGVQIGETNTTDDSSSFNTWIPSTLHIGWSDGQDNPASTKNFAFSSIGEGFTPTEVLDDYTVIQAFQTVLGRNV